MLGHPLLALGDLATVGEHARAGVGAYRRRARHIVTFASALWRSVASCVRSSQCGARKDGAFPRWPTSSITTPWLRTSCAGLRARAASHRRDRPRCPRGAQTRSRDKGSEVSSGHGVRSLRPDRFGGAGLCVPGWRAARARGAERGSARVVGLLCFVAATAVAGRVCGATAVPSGALSGRAVLSVAVGEPPGAFDDDSGAHTEDQVCDDGPDVRAEGVVAVGGAEPEQRRHPLVGDGRHRSAHGESGS